MVKTYYLFRHGLTHAVKTGTGYGEDMLTAPILKEARVPLEKMGEYLKDKKIDFFVSSPLKRCQQSARIISKITGLKFATDDRLTEFFMETHEMLHSRIKTLLREVDKKGCNNAAICTHGSVISELISQLAGQKDGVSTYDIFHYPGPGNLVVISNGNIGEINFNNSYPHTKS